MAKKNYDSPSPWQLLRPYKDEAIARMKHRELSWLRERRKAALKEAQLDLSQADDRVYRAKLRAHEQLVKEIQSLESERYPNFDLSDAESVAEWRAWCDDRNRKLGELCRKRTDPPVAELATEKEYKMRAVASLVRLQAALLGLSDEERGSLDKALYIRTQYDYKKARAKHSYAEDAAEALAERYVEGVYGPAIRSRTLQKRRR